MKVGVVLLLISYCLSVQWICEENRKRGSFMLVYYRRVILHHVILHGLVSHGHGTTRTGAFGSTLVLIYIMHKCSGCPKGLAWFHAQDPSYFKKQETYSNLLAPTPHNRACNRAWLQAGFMLIPCWRLELWTLAFKSCQPMPSTTFFRSH